MSDSAPDAAPSIVVEGITYTVNRTPIKVKVGGRPKLFNRYMKESWSAFAQRISEAAAADQQNVSLAPARTLSLSIDPQSPLITSCGCLARTRDTIPLNAGIEPRPPVCIMHP